MWSFAPEHPEVVRAAPPRLGLALARNRAGSLAALDWYAGPAEAGGGAAHEWCFYGWREGAAHRFFAQTADANTQAAWHPSERLNAARSWAKLSAPCNEGPRSCVVLDV